MKSNNIIFYFAVIIIAAFVTLFLPWGTFTAQTGSDLFIDTQVTNTGLNGSSSLFGISIKHWLLVVFSVIASLIFILNIKQLIKITKIVPIFINVFVLLWLVLTVYVYMSAGSVGMGLILMILATISSLFLAATSKSI